MYQQRDIKELNELQFESLINEFKKMFPSSESKIDEMEWNLEKTYKPIFACIWNKVGNIEKDCIILQKNNSFALVQFETPQETILTQIYRLQDLA